MKLFGPKNDDICNFWYLLVKFLPKRLYYFGSHHSWICKVGPSSDLPKGILLSFYLKGSWVSQKGTKLNWTKNPKELICLIFTSSIIWKDEHFPIFVRYLYSLYKSSVWAFLYFLLIVVIFFLLICKNYLDIKDNHYLCKECYNFTSLII